jgi:hypothetical protein
MHFSSWQKTLCDAYAPKIADLVPLLKCRAAYLLPAEGDPRRWIASTTCPAKYKWSTGFMGWAFSSCLLLLMLLAYYWWYTSTRWNRYDWHVTALYDRTLLSLSSLIATAASL